MRWIIDASAGIQIALNRKANDRISDILEDNIINTPTLYIAETGNGFWKYVIYQNMALQDARRLHQRCLDIVDNILPAQILSERAMFISTTKKITFYDALYLSLAQMQECGIISFDKKLLTTAQSLGIKTI